MIGNEIIESINRKLRTYPQDILYNIITGHKLYGNLENVFSLNLSRPDWTRINALFKMEDGEFNCGTFTILFDINNNDIRFVIEGRNTESECVSMNEHLRTYQEFLKYTEKAKSDYKHIFRKGRVMDFGHGKYGLIVDRVVMDGINPLAWKIPMRVFSFADSSDKRIDIPIWKLYTYRPSFVFVDDSDVIDRFIGEFRKRKRMIEREMEVRGIDLYQEKCQCQWMINHVIYEYDTTNGKKTYENAIYDDITKLVMTDSCSVTKDDEMSSRQEEKENVSELEIYLECPYRNVHIVRLKPEDFHFELDDAVEGQLDVINTYVSRHTIDVEGCAAGSVDLEFTVMIYPYNQISNIWMEVKKPGWKIIEEPSDDIYLAFFQDGHFDKVFFGECDDEE